jgi:hypothetical protein
VTQESSWYRNLASSRAADEAGYIVREFDSKKKIKIDGVPSADGGVDFMYARGRLLAREQYLGGIEQEQERARRLPGVLDILRNNGAPDAHVVRRVVRDIVLVSLDRVSDSDKETSESKDQPAGDSRKNAESDDNASKGDGENSGGLGGTAEGDQPSVLRLLDIIDEQLGVGIATPDHVVTVAGVMGPCPATEPQEVYGPREPFPAVCPGDGGAGVRIFIADTGLLDKAAENFWWLHGVKGEKDPRTGSGGTILPYDGHGTFVAGVVRCMAPKAEIRVANIFDTAGSALESEFVPRLNEAFEFSFDILHLTVACSTRKNVQLLALEAWLRLLDSYKGVVCVVPAGNNETQRPHWPAALPRVISVGALSANRRSRAFFSNYGGWVDVYAPGQNLVNAYAEGTYKCETAPYTGLERKFFGMAQWSGTSFSTPIVTGLIAARMSRCGENAREAAEALLAKARAQTIHDVGAVLLPCCDDEDGDCCGDDHGGCGCDGGDCGGSRHCGCGSRHCGCGRSGRGHDKPAGRR